MQKVWLWTMLAVVMAGLFVGGLVLGLSVNEPNVAALRAETAEQQSELDSLQSRLTSQDAKLASVGARLGDITAERSGLTVALDASRSTVSGLELDTARLSVELDNVQQQLEGAETTLAASEKRTRNLQVEVLGLTESQRDLGTAIGLLKELEELDNAQFGPNHGDAMLLVEEGYRAANNENFTEAAKFFRESSKAYELAKENAEALTAKSGQIAELVPEELNQTFVESHRQARSTVFAMEAQARTYEAADHLYTIIGEWADIEDPTRSDRSRWGELADRAEDQFELAMQALDEADTWSPGLWRRTEALRLNTRDWRNLLLGIRFNLIDVR